MIIPRWLLIVIIVKLSWIIPAFPRFSSSKIIAVIATPQKVILPVFQQIHRWKCPQVVQLVFLRQDLPWRSAAAPSTHRALQLQRRAMPGAVITGAPMGTSGTQGWFRYWMRTIIWKLEIYPLVMTNSLPWYRWPIEIEGLPFLKMVIFHG